MRLFDALRALHRDESGQDLVEYALVLAAIAAAVVASSSSLASVVSNAVSAINVKIATEINSIS